MVSLRLLLFWLGGVKLNLPGSTWSVSYSIVTDQYGGRWASLGIEDLQCIRHSPLSVSTIGCIRTQKEILK